VVVNAVALKAGTSAPDDTLGREDFQVFDNGRRVQIKTFDKGGAARPLAVWLLVQCSMPGWAKEGSGIFADKLSLLRPALSHLTRQDSVGVAHWCDNGDSAVDLRQTRDVDAAVSRLREVLTPVVTVDSHTRSGELALQSAVQKIVDCTRSLSAERVPVVIFLYDDYSAMPKGEADGFVDALLKTSTTVYGVKDGGAPRAWGMGTEKGSIAGYFANRTGGHYISADPETYCDGLQRIIDEVHLRYELGFTPETLDGKRHAIRVALSDAGKQRHKHLTIRYRTGYVAAGEER
jgi:hypothetical protein